jgi:hypothetical protein
VSSSNERFGQNAILCCAHTHTHAKDEKVVNCVDQDTSPRLHHTGSVFPKLLVGNHLKSLQTSCQCNHQLTSWECKKSQLLELLSNLCRRNSLFVDWVLDDAILNVNEWRGGQTYNIGIAHCANLAPYKNSLYRLAIL